ncbi:MULTISPECIES: glycosyltransferase family 2 protein [unclassified Coleofasciculus]|uniref:glycosyltransferase family 2 protein n=1 Tax=Cyanophyceae TaxID=3028117 RepID=UPI001689D811|nr:MULTISPECIES: glycosyltransferase family 2 protein [unclassified Coleofasciculus]MBD2083700.1 glycosyltransferase family 2 protein [Coleofasciculus sp. FACHB-542]MBD2537883.1 glycosyltransferase family 2 protein [Coleofasciculus sp. FACHB-SPT36]
MSEQYKIAGYITAYENPTAVIDCINAITCQSLPVEKLLIVDNSSTKPLLHLTNQENILIKFHPENIGIGAGLTWAIAWAIKQGYDFLWAFDQDSVPEYNCLEILLEVYKKFSSNKYKIGITAPTPIDSRNNKIVQGAVFKKDSFRGYGSESLTNPYDCDAPITSGSLISIAAAKTIPPPRSDLFIDGIDLDYGLRLKQAGYHNLIVPNAFMKHNFGEPLKIKFINKEIIIQKYSALRHYYICRNHTYLETNYAQGVYKFISVLRRVKYLIYTIIKIIVFDPKNKFFKMWGCLIGTFHGLIGKLGKTWN